MIRVEENPDTYLSSVPLSWMKAAPVLLALAAPSPAFAHDFFKAAELAHYFAAQFKEDQRSLALFYDAKHLECSREGSDPRCRTRLFELDVYILTDSRPDVMNVVLVKRRSRTQNGDHYMFFTRDAYSPGFGADRIPASRGVGGGGPKPREIPLPDYLASLSFGRPAGSVRADQVYVLIAEEEAPPQDLPLEIVELASDWMVVEPAGQGEGSPIECYRRRDLVDPRREDLETSLDATVPLYFLNRTDLKHAGEAKIAHYSARASGRFLKARAKPRYSAEYKISDQLGNETAVQRIKSFDQTWTGEDAAFPERLFTRVTFLGAAPTPPTPATTHTSQHPGDQPRPGPDTSSTLKDRMRQVQEDLWRQGR